MTKLYEDRGQRVHQDSLHHESEGTLHCDMLCNISRQRHLHVHILKKIMGREMTTRLLYKQKHDQLFP